MCRCQVGSWLRPKTDMRPWFLTIAPFHFWSILFRKWTRCRFRTIYWNWAGRSCLHFCFCWHWCRYLYRWRCLLVSKRNFSSHQHLVDLEGQRHDALTKTPDLKLLTIDTGGYPKRIDTYWPKQDRLWINWQFTNPGLTLPHPKEKCAIRSPSNLIPGQLAPPSTSRCACAHGCARWTYEEFLTGSMFNSKPIGSKALVLTSIYFSFL